jgi:MarR family 2-MHQ and catechol resistance regulon transcriptional repressor
MPHPTSRKRAITDVSRLIQSFARFYQLRRRDDLCRHGVTVSQCYALETIVAAGELGVTELAHELALNKSSASRVVESLCGLGLVTWSPAPGDARAKRVTPTRAGAELSQRIHADIEQEHARLLKAFPPRDIEACRQLLSSLVADKRSPRAAK